MSIMTTKEWLRLGAMLAVVSTSASAFTEVSDFNQMFAAGTAKSTENIPLLLLPADITTGCTFTHASTIRCTVSPTAPEIKLPFSHSAGESNKFNVAILNKGSTK